MEGRYDRSCELWVGLRRSAPQSSSGNAAPAPRSHDRDRLPVPGSSGAGLCDLCARAPVSSALGGSEELFGVLGVFPSLSSSSATRFSRRVIVATWLDMIADWLSTKASNSEICTACAWTISNSVSTESLRSSSTLMGILNQHQLARASKKKASKRTPHNLTTLMPQSAKQPRG